MLNNSSSSTPADQTVDVFMQYVSDHGYKIIPNSEAGGQIHLINFYNVKSSDQIIVILNSAYVSSKKLGYDFLPYQGDTVIFHTCAIDSDNGNRAEADCFTYNNKIVGFWIYTSAVNADKTEDQSFIILSNLG